MESRHKKRNSADLTPPPQGSGVGASAQSLPRVRANTQRGARRGRKGKQATGQSADGAGAADAPDRVAVGQPAADQWKRDVEEILRNYIPNYDPWSQAEDSWLDHGAALEAINFFAENLKHVEGSARGQPFILRKWQAAIIGNLFGWKRKDDAGRIVRRFRMMMGLIPRGNGKTPLAAGIVLYAFYEDREPGAQNYLAAGDKNQAGYLFRNARGMVDQNESLRNRVTVYGGDQHRSMVLKDDPLSFCKTIPADAAGQHGGIPHITVVDELHVQESRDLLDVFETAMAKKVRAQPLLVMITTSDFERVSICNEEYDIACRVRDNGGDRSKRGYDPSYLPVIYEVPADEDWRNEKNWIKANPNLNVSVEIESLRTMCRKAMETPSFENTFRRLHLNQRTSRQARIVPMKKWDACNKRLDLEFLKGRPCYGGLDLSSSKDLSSFGLVFPLDDEEIAILSYSFCPEVQVETRAGQKIPYDLWERDGHLISTPGNQIDYDVIEATIDQAAELYAIQDIGFDRKFAPQLESRLREKHGENS
jgi:phage terminase large subunit-like protein